jgi:hypothetical protein
MNNIFISYRRDDASGQAGRLFDRLIERFGEEHVFMDVSDLRPGQDFVTEIEGALEGSDVMLALIGPQWIDAKGSTGQRRLDDPWDFVRREIATALARGTMVIPVLIRGASMPDAAALPEPLQLLARRQAIELTDRRWAADVKELIAALEPVQQPTEAPAGQTSPRTDGQWAARRLFSYRFLALGLVVAMVGLWMLLKLTPERPDAPPIADGPATAKGGSTNSQDRPAHSGNGPKPQSQAEAPVGARHYALALPELREITFRSSSGKVVYRLLAIRLEARDAGSEQLTFLIRMHNRDSVSQNFWDSSFRLTAGDHRLEPVSNLNVVVGGHAAKEGEVAFVVPASLAAVELEVTYSQSDKTLIPIALGTRTAIAADAATDEFGRQKRARLVDALKPLPATLPAGQRVRVGRAEFVLVKAAVARETTERAALLLTVRCTVSREHYAMNFWSDSVRLVVDGIPREPANSVNELVSGGAAKEAEFVFSLEVMPQTLAVQFLDAGDMATVPLALTPITTG